MANKELSKMHVVVTDTETGEVMVDETRRTVLVVMNDYDDNEDNEYVETVQFMNGTLDGIVNGLMSGKAFKLARMAVVATSIAEQDEEQEDDE